MGYNRSYSFIRHSRHCFSGLGSLLRLSPICSELPQAGCWLINEFAATICGMAGNAVPGEKKGELAMADAGEGNGGKALRVFGAVFIWMWKIVWLIVKYSAKTLWWIVKNFRFKKSGVWG